MNSLVGDNPTHITHTEAGKKQPFYKTFDGLLEGVQILDRDWRFVYVNRVLASEIKISSTELLGQKLIDVFPDIEQTAVFKVLAQCMEDRQPRQVENEFCYPDKTKKWYKLNIEPIEEGILILSLDITAYKEALEKVSKINRLYAFITQVNQNIVRVKDEASLFRNSCRIALEFGKFKVAWIGMFDTARHNINLVEQSGLPFEDSEHFVNMAYDDKGPQAYVLRTGMHYICNNIEQDFELEHWKPYAARHAVKSCMVLPIKKSGSVVGTFNLYSTELNFSNKEEIPLLLQITEDISFALDMFERAKKQQETEARVINNEKHFRALIENSADMISLSSAAGKLLYVSPSVLKQFGYSIEDVCNIIAFEFIHPDDLAQFLVNREMLLQTPGKSIYYQHRLRHKNGTWIWVEATITNMLNEPCIHALVSNFRDISDKKAVEMQLEFDRTNLDALMNNTKDIMWSVDRDFNLITSNRPFDEIVKKLSGNAMPKGSSIAGNFSKEIVANRIELYERAFLGEAFSVVEYGLVGHDRWSDISYYPIKIGDKVIGTACNIRDITTNKEAELALKKSERFNRALFRSLQSHIAVVNGEGLIVAVNEAWKKFAVENGDSHLTHTCKGTNYFEVCTKSASHGDNVAADVLIGLKDVMHQKTNFFYLEYPCNSPKQQRWFALHVMKFDSDEPMVVVSHQDISERKFAQDKLIYNNQELQKTNSELDRFVYSVSHDLRSPLTSILGLISFIEEESKEASTLAHTKMIKSGINRLDGFIKNILSYSRNNRTEPELEKIPLNKTVEDIVDSLRGIKETNEIDFKINIDEKIAFFSDIQRFKTIMENLISNAIKYHRQHGTGRFIKVTGQSTKDILRIVVKDNGIGIAPEYHHKIFDMFYRLPGNLVGSGIGLYIVKEMIEKLEGTITVASGKGQGTTFIITIKNYKHDNYTNTKI